MKKILWFSNCIQSQGANKASGSWLFSMARLLCDSGKVHLINIAKARQSGSTKIEYKKISDSYEEYIQPNLEIDRNGFPSTEKCNEIKVLCQEIHPDIIHVWGVENYFCTLLPTFSLSVPLLLEIQGLHGTCAGVYYGDMSVSDTLRCFGLREILFPFMKSIYVQKHQMRDLGDKDIDAIKKYQHISVQSRWIEDRIKMINPVCNLYQTRMSLRKEFISCPKWEYNDNCRNFYCSAAGPTPYKSIQTAIKALKVVTEKYSSACLYIIGNFSDSNWLHQSGYLTFLKKTIKNLGLERNVIFTGALTATGIVDVMHKCIGMVQTSYVESYSLAVAEAQAVGVPSVISYAGAMPELAENRNTGLFFSPGDNVSCANRMIELIENKELAMQISQKSRELANERNSDDIVLATQLNIYDKILSNND